MDYHADMILFRNRKSGKASRSNSLLVPGTRKAIIAYVLRLFGGITQNHDILPGQALAIIARYARGRGLP